MNEQNKEITSKIKICQKEQNPLTDFLNVFFNFIPNIIHINFSFRRKRKGRNITNRIKRFLQIATQRIIVKN